MLAHLFSDTRVSLTEIIARNPLVFAQVSNYGNTERHNIWCHSFHFIDSIPLFVREFRVTRHRTGRRNAEIPFFWFPSTPISLFELVPKAYCIPSAYDYMFIKVIMYRNIISNKNYPFQFLRHKSHNFPYLNFYCFYFSDYDI